MPQKQFRLRPDQIQPLAEGHGACIASDMITVRGHRVGWMFRQQPDKQPDSGWRFFSGEETQDYVDDAKNLMMYDINTIANYDPDIIPFLTAPYGSAFERNSTGQFVEVEFDTDDDPA